MSKETKLREGFSAFVHTTAEQVVATLNGPVRQHVTEFVAPGGELPDNMQDGEYERLKDLGAFEPVPPVEQRVVGVIANNPVLLHATAPEGEAVATPSDIRESTKAEEKAAEALRQAQQDLHDARLEAAQEHQDATGLGDPHPPEGQATQPGAVPVPHVPVEGADHAKTAGSKRAEAPKTAGSKRTPAKKQAPAKKGGGSVHGR